MSASQGSAVARCALCRVIDGKSQSFGREQRMSQFSFKPNFGLAACPSVAAERWTHGLGHIAVPGSGHPLVDLVKPLVPRVCCACPREIWRCGMPIERIESVVIGAGQAGLAMSHHLRKRGAEHVVLERGQVAERWRSERWD